MNKEEILNKYCELLDKGYCDDCNELNCITNGNMKLISKAIKESLQEKEKLKQALIDIREYIKSWTVYECDKNTVRELSFESNKENISQIIDKVLDKVRGE